ncbi:hypothetical protein D9615_006870 [Tricholomella constricta]|uniref:DUF6699 domain-containing protein n=1 Tax=Tricholomella constricta TaxID=117010 RepID=A0A8H5H8Q3_9AGAR|nr:hypothetical protein D9615_006870 [Tricholomella constricta]
MPQKTVRFREENEANSSPPRTSSSPPFSADNPSSQPTPTMPPSPVHAATVPTDESLSLDTAFYGQDGLHTELGHDTQLFFDMRYPPFGTVNDLNASFNSSDLKLAATYTPQPFMTIQCKLLPWAIEIFPRHGCTYVTVQDVLVGIFDSLQCCATAEEFQREKLMKREEIENQRVLRRDLSRRRIDWLLMDDCCFLGLSHSIGNVWRLRVND